MHAPDSSPILRCSTSRACSCRGRAPRAAAAARSRVEAVLTEPQDLDQAELKHVLEGRWGLRDPQLDYLAVGFGSHHWRAVDAGGTRRFVTVDDLEADFRAEPDTDSAFAALDQAFRTAAVLRDDATLDFVVAPLFDRDWAVIRRLSHRYAVTVSPFIDGTRARGARTNRLMTASGWEACWAGSTPQPSRSASAVRKARSSAERLSRCPGQPGNPPPGHRR